MKIRPDGSVQSTSTPTLENIDYFEDNSLYRCMVTKVIYTDDPNNITTNAKNPRVLYDVVVLGGFASGQIISNCRLASSLGGDFNFFERTLRPASKNVSKTRLESNDGDIVFVQFIQGNNQYPVIISLDNGVNTEDSIGATIEDAQILNFQYNGVSININNLGDLILTKKNGEFDSELNSFIPSDEIGSLFSLTGASDEEDILLLHKTGALLNIDKDGSVKIISQDGGTLFLNTDTGEASIISTDGNVLTLGEEYILGFSDGGKTISLKDSGIEAISDADIIFQAANNFLVEAGAVSMQASSAPGVPGGKLAVTGTGQVALGNALTGVELLDIVDQIISELITLTTAMAAETHIGNLGFPTSPPVNVASYIATTTSLTAIQILLTTIKGSL